MESVWRTDVSARINEQSLKARKDSFIRMVIGSTHCTTDPFPPRKGRSGFPVPVRTRRLNRWRTLAAYLGEASNLRHNQLPVACFAAQASAEDDNRTMAFPFAVKVQATASSCKDARLGRTDYGAAEHKHSDKKSCTRCRHNLLPNVDDLLNQYLVR